MTWGSTGHYSDASGQNSAPRPDMPKKLFGYEVQEYLGEGAASHLYVVTAPGNPELLALKHVVRKTEKEDRFIDQLMNEYEVGKKVTHRALRKSLAMKTDRTILHWQIHEAILVLESFDGGPVD